MGAHYTVPWVAGNGTRRFIQTLQQNVQKFLAAQASVFYQHLCALFKDYWYPGQSAGDRLMRACREQNELHERRHQMELAQIANDDIED